MSPDSVISIDLDDYFIDPEGLPLRFSAKSKGLNVNVNGSFLEIMSGPWPGLYPVSVRVRDPEKNWIKVTFQVNVSATWLQEQELSRLRSLGLEPVSIRQSPLGVDFKFSLGEATIGLSGINLTDLREFRILDISQALVADRTAELTTGTVAVNPLPFGSAEITLPKRGPVNTILRCEKPDFEPIPLPRREKR